MRISAHSSCRAADPHAMAAGEIRNGPLLSLALWLELLSHPGAFASLTGSRWPHPIATRA